MANDQIIIYQTADGETTVDVRLEDENVWLTQGQMQELFNQTRQNVSLHINNIFSEGELTKSETVKESLTVQNEGKRSVKRTKELAYSSGHIQYWNLSLGDIFKYDEL